MGILSFLFFINLVLISEYLHRKKARSENSAKVFIKEQELARSTGKNNLNVKEYTA